MSSYAGGGPGPDGLSFIFYQQFWEVIKGDVMALVRDFENGTLDVQRLNYSIVTLIPKEPDAKNMRKFRPISLLNCCFKIFTKVLTNRLALIIGKLIYENQSAFIRGRYILESVVTTHEVLHSVHSSKRQGLVLKLDYEKAFDKVNVEFLEELLRKRGFGDKWVHWILQVTRGGSVGVKLNNTESDFFLTGKGLRQGDPISPLLFNLVVDILTRMLMKAANHQLIEGLCAEICPGRIICFQYADDTLLIVQADETQLLALKDMLVAFHKSTGLKVNFHKSCILPINVSPEETTRLATVFGCQVGTLPFTYLGLPVGTTRPRIVDLVPVVDRFERRLSVNSSLLSQGARLQLLIISSLIHANLLFV